MGEASPPMGGWPERVYRLGLFKHAFWLWREPPGCVLKSWCVYYSHTEAVLKEAPPMAYGDAVKKAQETEGFILKFKFEKPVKYGWKT